MTSTKPARAASASAERDPQKSELLAKAFNSQISLDHALRQALNIAPSIFSIDLAALVAMHALLFGGVRK